MNQAGQKATSNPANPIFFVKVLYKRISVILGVVIFLVVGCDCLYAQNQVTDAVINKSQNSAKNITKIGEEVYPSGTTGGPMIYVPEGEFMMGCNEKIKHSCQANEKPYHKIFLDSFYIDKFEVTTEQYSKCVQDGICRRLESSSTRCNWMTINRSNHPINCVSWNDADIYCKSVGKRLLTEAEWEYAARGEDGRIYPWGNTAPTSEYIFPRYDSWKSFPVGNDHKDISPFGVMDMAGNVCEWLSDWYDQDYFRNSPSKNPKGPSWAIQHTIRGYDFRAESRSTEEEFHGSPWQGIRCGLNYSRKSIDSKGENLTNYMELAINAILKGDKNRIVKIAKEWIQKEKNNPLPTFLINISKIEKDVLIKPEIYNSVTIWLKELANSYPDNQYTHYLLGFEYLIRRNYADAIKQFEKVVEISPNFAEAHFYLGNCYCSKGKYDLAEEEYLKVIEIGGVHRKDAYFNIGIILLRPNTYESFGEESLLNFNNAKRIEDDADIHYALGYIYYKRKNIDQALAEWKEAVRQNPQYSSALYNMGIAYFYQNKMDLAKAAFKDSSHHNLGVIYFNENKYELAVKELECIDETSGHMGSEICSIIYAIESAIHGDTDKADSLMGNLIISAWGKPKHEKYYQVRKYLLERKIDSAIKEIGKLEINEEIILPNIRNLRIRYEVYY